MYSASTKANTCAKTKPEWDLRDDGKEIYQGRNSRVSALLMMTMMTTMTTMMMIIAMMMVGVVMMMIKSNCNIVL